MNFNKLINAGIWNFFERFYTQLIRFSLNIVLARILLPEDYGTIGLVLIFLAVSNSFIEGGFINALIQKQNRTESDYSTTFYFNVVLAIIFYLLFFWTAPFVSDFYNISELTSIMRVLCLSILFNALTIVPRAKFAVNLDFKNQSIATSLSVTISGLISIYLAYNGLGVWTLVYQSVIMALLNAFFFNFFVKWRPSLKFSSEGFKELFSFGSKLLITNLINRVFINLYYTVIGKSYNMSELGYYSKAEQFTQLPATNISGLIQNITFPQMCEVQNNNILLRKYYIKSIKYASIVCIPLFFYLCLYSKPIILLVLTEKWIEAYPLFSLMSIAGLIYPLNFLSTNLLLAIKKVNLHLKLEIINKILAVLVLFFTIKVSIKAVIIGQISIAIIFFIVNSYYVNKKINYPISKLVIDLLPIFTFAAISVGFSFYSTINLKSNFLIVILGLLISVFLYFSFLYFLNISNIRDLTNSKFLKYFKNKSFEE